MIRFSIVTHDLSDHLMNKFSMKAYELLYAINSAIP